jgi:hypothetical protein
MDVFMPETQPQPPTPTQTTKLDVAQVEATPPHGRLGFDPDHIAVHHLQLNQNAKSPKSPNQM